MTRESSHYELRQIIPAPEYKVLWWYDKSCVKDGEVAIGVEPAFGFGLCDTTVTEWEGTYPHSRKVNSRTYRGETVALVYSDGDLRIANESINFAGTVRSDASNQSIRECAQGEFPEVPDNCKIIRHP